MFDELSTDEWVANFFELNEGNPDANIFFQAMAESRTDVLDFCLEPGCRGGREILDILGPDKKGVTVMHIAALHGYLEVMKWIQEKIKEELQEIDADEFIQPDKEGIMPIHNAAKGGHREAVEWLLENGANVNFRDGKEQTPMHHAAGNGRVGVMKSLKDAADIKAEDIYGSWPIHSAIACDKIESIRCLVKELGMDVNAKNNHKNHNGKTPLFFAAMLGKTNIIRFLVDLGADVNARDNDGETPLFTAAQAGQIESIKCLVGLKADVNAKSDNGMTPIFLAAGTGQIESIKCLVDLKADVNAKTDNGMTPIFLAAGSGQIGSIKCLKSLGAKLEDKEGAIDLALRYNQTEAAKWLRANF